MMGDPLGREKTSGRGHDEKKYKTRGGFTPGDRIPLHGLFPYSDSLKKE